jgi:hypothetical protein
MNNLIPPIPRFIVKAGITILWICVRIVGAILKAFAGFLNVKRKNPF